MNIEIANRLVNLRKQNNLSQEALAEKLGISRQAVSKWERAEASPDTDNLILLSRLYGVSLDQLLQTVDEIPAAEPEESDSEETKEKEAESKDTSGENTSTNNEYTNQKGDNTFVHIGKDGIHVLDGEEQVHINWKGVHVNDKNGDSVKVGWDGIHIKEDGQDVFWKEEKKDYRFEPKLRFPVGMIIVVVYLVFGIAYHAWHPGWLLLLLIPIFESLITAIQKRNANRFAYPIVAILFFLAYGIFTGDWIGWVALLTIPIYYSLVSYIKSLIRHRKWRKQKQAASLHYTELEDE
ncbi:MAG TPA: helix-turn-helix domain-containing protein [Lachnospiraceae bacterium]|nr:helix-turn-helix domain-containing protein [Lachnospiraceae bacterium]